MQKINKRILIYFFILFIVGCNSKNEKEMNAIKLNDQAINIYKSNNYNEDSLNKTLLLIDSAIKLDSNNILFYYNYSMIAKRLKKYDAAIKSCQKILLINKKEFTATLNLGFLYEVLKKSDSAKYFYGQSLSLFEKQKGSIKNPILKDRQKLILYGLLNDSTRFVSELTNFKKQYANQILYPEIYTELSNFNRSKYVEAY